MMSINNWTVQVALFKYAHEFIYFANHLHIYVWQVVKVNNELNM